jgi:hypothetical protein
MVGAWPLLPPECPIANPAHLDGSGTSRGYGLGLDAKEATVSRRASSSLRESMRGRPYRLPTSGRSWKASAQLPSFRRKRTPSQGRRKGAPLLHCDSMCQGFRLHFASYSGDNRCMLRALPQLLTYQPPAHLEGSEAAGSKVQSRSEPHESVAGHRGSPIPGVVSAPPSAMQETRCSNAHRDALAHPINRTSSAVPAAPPRPYR